MRSIPDSEIPCIGINLLFIVPGRNRGVQTYVDQLVRHLAVSGRFRYVLFVNKVNYENYREIDGVEIVRCSVNGGRRAFRVAYEQVVLQFVSRKHRCDILFFPGYLAPVIKLLPFVVTVHDTQFRDIPSMVSSGVRRLYELIVPRAIRQADKVLTVSEFSKSRILRHFKVEPDRVIVTPLSSTESQLPDIKVPQLDLFDKAGLVANGFAPEKPFLISVSSANKHKNLDALVDAFVEANQSRKFQLVLIGAEKADCPDLVFSTGFVANEVRDHLYRKALGYVFASKYEGFGLPLLEAMEAGIPIACSSSASLPEVGGDACIYFDPDDHSEMVHAIKRLCEDESLRQDLISKGRNQRSLFSWKKCSEITENAFAAVIEENE